MKKKRKSKKGKMPAGLRKYWAKKRATKRRRKNSRKMTPYERIKSQYGALAKTHGLAPIKKQRTKKRKASSGFNAADRKRALALLKRSVGMNPRRKKRKASRRRATPLARVRAISLPKGLTATQERRVIGIIRRVSKRRVRVQQR